MNHKSNAFNQTNSKRQHFFITFVSVMGERQTETRHFAILFEQYKEPFTLFANSYIRDTAVAEDIYVEAMMQYWEKRHELPSDTNIPAYILETIKHKCLNYLRHLRVREDVEQRLREHQQRVTNLRIVTLEACDPQEIFSDEAQRLVDEALAMMSDKTRQIFIMSRYENKTYPEIAAHFSLSVKSVEFHISKALKILKVKLKDYMTIMLFL